MSRRSHPFPAVSLAALAAILAAPGLWAPPAIAQEAGLAVPALEADAEEASHPSPSSAASVDAPTFPENIGALLPLVVTLPEHRKLAAHLETLIRQGDVAAAERELRAAIEVGTLASILVDWLRYPDFLPALQALDLHEEAAASPPEDRAVGDSGQKSDLESGRGSSQVAELKGALERERAQAERAAQDLASATEQLKALRAEREHETASAANRENTWQASLNRERSRAESAAAQLASLRAEDRTLRADREREIAATETALANLRNEVVQERRRSEAAQQQLSVLLEEIRVFRGIREAGATPLIFRLEKLGVHGPLNAGDGPARAPVQPVRVETIPVQPAATNALTPPEMPPAAQAAPPPAVAVAAPAEEPMEERLAARGKALLEQGDVSGARLLLARAREAGSARATFLLAETYDPHVLAERGVVGIRSDAARAQDLYAEALAKGIGQAGARLQALR